MSTVYLSRFDTRAGIENWNWEEWDKRVDWCLKHFGSGGAYAARERWWADYPTFFFTEEKDYVFFTLRWS
jgi:hypothetical protein